MIKISHSTPYSFFHCANAKKQLRDATVVALEQDLAVFASMADTRHRRVLEHC
jgi:hypothetical protein